MKPKSAGPVRVKSGQFIVTEGDSGTEMYLIEEGTVEILKQVGAGEPQILRVLGPGEFFGELAILAHLPRNSSARAKTDCGLVAIDEATFDHMLHQYPDVAMRILRSLARRLHDADAARGGDEKAAGPAAPATGPPERATPPRPAPPSAARPSKPPTSVRGRSTGDTGKTRGACLVHKPSGATLPLSGGPELTVGRYDADTGQRPDVDLLALDTSRSTSRRHATILREDGKFFVLEPKATANGTFVNGTRIATGVRVALKSGDELRFGNVTMSLQTA